MIQLPGLYTSLSNLINEPEGLARRPFSSSKSGCARDLTNR